MSSKLPVFFLEHFRSAAPLASNVHHSIMFIADVNFTVSLKVFFFKILSLIFCHFYSNSPILNLPYSSMYMFSKLTLKFPLDLLRKLVVIFFFKMSWPPPWHSKYTCLYWHCSLCPRYSAFLLQFRYLLQFRHFVCMHFPVG